MLSTAVLVTFFLGILCASMALWALMLWLGLRWAKAEHVTIRRLIGTTVIVSLLGAGLSLLFLVPEASTESQAVLWAFLQIVIQTVVSCLVIGVAFKIKFWRALQAWLPTLIASAGMLCFSAFVLRPYIYEAFISPTNGIAPTILGEHWRGSCPECGARNYCSPRDDRYDRLAPRQMICENFHIAEAEAADKTIHPCDRFLVAKFLAPRRWDLVVFQKPDEPTVIYVKRLVGLPGETIQLQDGFVWVGGEKQTPPDSLQDIQYLSEVPNWRGPPLWGSTERPAKLGGDEYFVLGDFSSQSLDSRLWQQGAPGYQPFAVPESYIRGVVTHTFWPLARLRIHR